MLQARFFETMSADTTLSPVNPPGTSLGRINAVVGGHGRHVVEKFEGPLSIKFMARGTGIWRTPERLYRVEEGYFLVLNARQTYALHFPSDEPHESFCPFFRDGFVEDIARSLQTPDGDLLDDPFGQSKAVEFPEHLRRNDGRMIPGLQALRTLVRDANRDGERIEEAFRVLGVALVRSFREDIASERARLPAVKLSTRAECHRRLMRARDYMHAHADAPLDLDRIAKAAALSPHHFHRLFKASFGEPPHRYLVRVRLDRAARLLRLTDLPVTEIAAKAGFENPGSFSTRFARQFGASPSAFRATR